MIPVYSADVCVCCAVGASSFFSLALITISGARQTRQTFEVFLFCTTHLGLLRCGWHFFSFSPLGSAQSGGSAKIQPWLAYIIDPPLFYIFFFFFVRSFAGWLLSASVCWMASVPPVKGEEISFDISKADLLSLLFLFMPLANTRRKS